MCVGFFRNSLEPLCKDGPLARIKVVMEVVWIPLGKSKIQDPGQRWGGGQAGGMAGWEAGGGITTLNPEPANNNNNNKCRTPAVF